VAIKYVSAQGAFDLGVARSSSKALGIRSSSTDYETRAAAANLKARLDAGSTREHERTRVGILYDPLQSWDAGACRSPWRACAEAAKDSSRKLLRRQVRDLVAWLKGQGAI
jgi:hypothetical protein